MTNRILRIVLVLTTAGAAACGFEHQSSMTNPTSPTIAGSSSLLGTWTSSNIIPSPSSCTDFKWTVTEQTANTAKGNFSATCAGDLKVSGTANGTLSGSNVMWTAQATASVPNLPACAISLTGTAELGVDSIRVPYSGDTCLGKVSGVEVLKKN